MALLRHTPRIRSLIPQAVRERMYDWHPGRARRWRRRPGIERVTPGGHAVLTLDDGPDQDATPAVLDALDTAGARATFFLLASQVQRDLPLAQEIHRRGHEIALHGYEHQRLDKVAATQSRQDVARGFDTIAQTMGVQCRWYRPPFGRMSDGAAEACAEFGMTPVYWSAWGVDWENVGADRIAEVASSQLDDGAILLLHDSARYGRRSSAMATAHAIPLIAEQAAQRGISLVTLGEATTR